MSSSICLKDEESSVNYKYSGICSSSEHVQTIYSNLFKSIDTKQTIYFEQVSKLLNNLFIEVQKIILPKGAKVFDLLKKVYDDKELDKIINNILSEIKKLKKMKKNGQLFRNKIDLLKNSRINLHLIDNKNNTIRGNSIPPKLNIKKYKDQNPKKEVEINHVDGLMPLNVKKNIKDFFIDCQNSLLLDSEIEQPFRKKSHSADKKKIMIKKIKIKKKIHY